MLYSFAFVLGALYAPLNSRTLLDLPWLLPTIFAVTVLICLCLRRIRAGKVSVIRSLIQTIFVWCSCALLGAMVALVGVQRLVEAQLDESWQGRNLRVRGQVVDVIDQTGTFTRFHFQVTDAEPETLATALRQQTLRLSWYYGPPVKTNQQWSLTVRLKRPRGFVNPRGFDYAAWLLSQNIIATGYIRSGEQLANGERRWSINGLRAALAVRLFPETVQFSPFFRALMFGDTSGIDAEQWRVLQHTGTIHLMAISGLHVGLVATIGLVLGWGLARALGLLISPTRCLRLSLWLPPLSSCCVAFGYSALAGFSIPTQRTVIVIGFVNLAMMLGLRLSPLRLLILACVLVVLGSPLAPTQNGFWLSFIAVLVLIIGFVGRPAPVQGLSALVKAQVLLTVGLLAPLLALGISISVTGPVANLVAVPVVSFIVVPGLLLSTALASVSPFLSEQLIQLLDLIFGLLWHYLVAMGKYSWVQWWPGVPTTSGLIVAIAAGCLLVLLPRGLSLKPLGALVLVLAFAAPRASAPFVQMTLLEVGQGLAVWVRTADYNLLYDTGPAFSESFDAGSRIVVPFLQSQGVKALDTLMVSHSDGDHSGGLEGVLNNMPVRQLMTGSPEIAGRYVGGSLCRQGQYWRRGTVSFHVLWPTAGGDGTSNNQSCVLLIEWASQRILLLGDVDADVERRLVAEGRLPTDIDVVVAGHHGSRTSSSRELLSHIRPKAVVFSAGYRSRYGHPHPEVVERFRQTGAMLFNTGRDGAISFSWTDVTDTEAEVIRARRATARAWY